MKKTKQKEERYRNINKMSDVRIMKNNNNTNVQYLASSLEEQSEICVTISAVGMPPLGSNSGLFTVSGFIVSFVGIFKK